jgi:hypothetical protein
MKLFASRGTDEPHHGLRVALLLVLTYYVHSPHGSSGRLVLRLIGNQSYSEDIGVLANPRG